MEWVTQRDGNLARHIAQVAADHGLVADPAAACVIELGLDTAGSATVAPVWAALLTGDPRPRAAGHPATRFAT